VTERRESTVNNINVRKGETARNLALNPVQKAGEHKNKPNSETGITNGRRKPRGITRSLTIFGRKGALCAEVSLSFLGEEEALGAEVSPLSKEAGRPSL